MSRNRSNRRRREARPKSLPHSEWIQRSYVVSPNYSTTTSSSTRSRIQGAVELFSRRLAARQSDVVRNTNHIRKNTAWVRPVLYEPATVAYRTQEKTSNTVCEARAQRKEVMHATGNAGKRGQNVPVFTANSKIRCRR